MPTVPLLLLAVINSRLASNGNTTESECVCEQAEEEKEEERGGGGGGDDEESTSKTVRGTTKEIEREKAGWLAGWLAG